MARENGRKVGLALKAKFTPAELAEQRRRGWITRRAKQADIGRIP